MLTRSLGAMQFFAGPPQGKLAPSGGSVLDEVKSVGAIKRLWIFLVFGTMHCSRSGELSTNFLCEFYPIHDWSLRVLRAVCGAAAWISVITPINLPNWLPHLRNLRYSWVSLIRGPVFIVGQRINALMFSI